MTMNNPAFGASPAEANPGAVSVPPGMTTHTDPRFGFRVTFPTGWAIHADERAIQIWRPDGAEFVLVAPFAPSAGLNSDDPSLIRQLPAVFPQLFPDAQMTRWTPAPAANGVGALGFRGPGEWSEARAMCGRRPDGGGLIFVVAAPQSRFESDKAGLIAILDSLQFGPPPNGPTSPGAAGTVTTHPADPADLQRAVEEAAARLQWVSWRDPREGAFSTEIPAGWAAEGGAIRFGLTDVRPVVHLSSPGGDITVQSGDANLMLFSPPTQLSMMMGQREGQIVSPTGTHQTMIARYMPPRLFARWYVGRFLAAEIDGLAPGLEQDLPEVALQQTRTLQQNGIPGQVEVAQLEFSGLSRRTRKRICGQIIASLTRYPPTPMGEGAWCAQVSWSTVTDGDAEAEARKATAVAVLLHLIQTWRDDPVWTARSMQTQQEILRSQQMANQQFSQQSHQMAMDNIAAAGQRSRMIAQQSDDRRHAMMSAFKHRRAAQDDVQRKFVNYVGDRTDVRDPATGQAWNVGSGYQHYYRDPVSDTILGTDSPNTPGVDWTPLREY